MGNKMSAKPETSQVNKLKQDGALDLGVEIQFFDDEDQPQLCETVPFVHYLCTSGLNLDKKSAAQRN